MLDLCLDPSDSYLAVVAVDITAGLEGSISSSVRLYEVGRKRPVAGDDDDDSDGDGDEVSTWPAQLPGAADTIPNCSGHQLQPAHTVREE